MNTGKRTRVKRVVLGVGHPWFSRRHNDTFDTVSLFTEDCGGICIPFKIGTLGGYNKIRLVVEILK